MVDKKTENGSMVSEKMKVVKKLRYWKFTMNMGVISQNVRFGLVVWALGGNVQRFRYPISAYLNITRRKSIFPGINYFSKNGSMLNYNILKNGYILIN